MFKTAEVLPADEHKHFHDNTFYLFILAITCLLRYPRRHNFNARFLNTVFSDKPKILTKHLYQLKGYNLRQFRTEFSDPESTPSSNNMLLKTFRDTVTVDRRQGSDRPRSASTNENIDQVNDVALSQENQPRS